MPVASPWSPAGFAVGTVMRRNGRHVLASAVREADGSAFWIKFPDQNAGEAAAAELLREAEILAEFQGHAFPRLIGQEDSAAGPVLLLEAFDGQLLADVCRGSPLPPGQFLQV